MVLYTPFSGVLRCHWAILFCRRTSNRLVQYSDRAVSSLAHTNTLRQCVWSILYSPEWDRETRCLVMDRHNHCVYLPVHVRASSDTWLWRVGHERCHRLLAACVKNQSVFFFLQWQRVNPCFHSKYLTELEVKNSSQTQQRRSVWMVMMF